MIGYGWSRASTYKRAERTKKKQTHGNCGDGVTIRFFRVCWRRHIIKPCRLIKVEERYFFCVESRLRNWYSFCILHEPACPSHSFLRFSVCYDTLLARTRYRTYLSSTKYTGIYLQALSQQIHPAGRYKSGCTVYRSAMNVLSVELWLP